MKVVEIFGLIRNLSLVLINDLLKKRYDAEGDVPGVLHSLNSELVFRVEPRQTG